MIQRVIACTECASPLCLLLGLDVHNFPECARMCLCYGLECAAGLGLPVNAFCVSHVLEGVTFCWWTSTRTYMFIPLLWSEPIAGSAATTAHMSSGTSASHTRPTSHASIMGAIPAESLRRPRSTPLEPSRAVPWMHPTLHRCTEVCRHAHGLC